MQHRCGRHHVCGLEWMEGPLPVQPGQQPAGDYPLLEALHGKMSFRISFARFRSVTLQSEQTKRYNTDANLSTVWVPPWRVVSKKTEWLIYLFLPFNALHSENR